MAAFDFCRRSVWLLWWRLLVLLLILILVQNPIQDVLPVWLLLLILLLLGLLLIFLLRLIRLRHALLLLVPRNFPQHALQRIILLALPSTFVPSQNLA